MKSVYLSTGFKKKKKKTVKPREIDIHIGSVYKYSQYRSEKRFSKRHKNKSYDVVKRTHGQ